MNRDQFAGAALRLTLMLLATAFLLALPAPGYAVNCPSQSGSEILISSDCTFSGTVNGADAGTGSTNTGIVTLQTGILTVNPGQTVAFGTLYLTGGSIALNGTLRPSTAIWMNDRDSDGYPDSTNQSADAGGQSYPRRRNLMVSTGNADCYDGDPATTNSEFVYPGQTTYFDTQRGDTSFDYDCDTAISKARDYCSCNCAGSCGVSCNFQASGDADACGTTGLNAGPASCNRNDDAYGTCISCTQVGTTTTTMKCR